MGINNELKKLYQEDQNQRQAYDAGGASNAALVRGDKRRLARLQLLPTLDLSEAWNCHWAALLLHHSSKRRDYERSHRLAKKAVATGSQASRWLYAATLDRLLISAGKKQRFGTQFKYDERSERWFHYPTDRRTTDKQRAVYCVPPLAELRRPT